MIIMVLLDHNKNNLKSIIIMKNLFLDQLKKHHYHANVFVSGFWHYMNIQTYIDKLNHYKMKLKDLNENYNKCKQN